MLDVPRHAAVGDEGLGWTPGLVDGQHVVFFRCPNDHLLTLFNPHQAAPRHGIGSDGAVDGSVVCKGRPGRPDGACDFHEHVRLLDYSGPAIARL